MVNASIEISSLRKSFSDLLVLDNISLSIPSGSIYGIIGLSGAGKSTLLRTINRLEEIDSGKIVVGGVDIHKLNRKELCEYRKKVAMIFQDFNLLNQKTVYENVEFPLTLDKKYKKTEEIKEKILGIINMVGLSEKVNSYPSQLSGGQKQRVAIARALVHDPKVLLCDEATSALDPTTSESILDLLKDLNTNLGITIVIVAHQMSIIEKICSRVAILSGSGVCEEGEVSQVFLKPETKAAKELIYSRHVKTRLQDKQLLKIEFDGDIDTPIVTNIVQDCNILVSIVYANSMVVKGKVYGQLIIKLPYYDEDIDKLKKYLDLRGIKYEEVTGDGVDEQFNARS